MGDAGTVDMVNSSALQYKQQVAQFIEEIKSDAGTSIDITTMVGSLCEEYDMQMLFGSKGDKFIL